jgi:hypothetical protein
MRMPIHRKANRLRLESLESRVCMSASTPTTGAYWVATLSDTATLNTAGSVVLFNTYNTVVGSDTFSVTGVSHLFSGTLTLQVNSSFGGVAVIRGTGAASSASSQSRTPTPSAKTPTPPTNAAPAVNDSQAGGDQFIVAVPPVQLQDKPEEEKRSLASTVDAALQANADSAATASSPASGFISTASAVGSSSAPSIAGSSLAVPTGERALERLSRIAPMEAPFAAGNEPIRAETFLAPSRDDAWIAVATPTRPTFAEAAVSIVAHSAVSAIATPVPPARYFGFTPMGMPSALASDSVAAFAEESASISAGVAVQARAVVFPWTFTFSVIAADIVLLTYIHRRSLRQRLAQAVHWPPVPRPAFSPAT